MHRSTTQPGLFRALALTLMVVAVVGFLPPASKGERSSRKWNFFAKKGKKKSGKSQSSKRPRLVVFDLDGCLWRPELYEILTAPRDSEGAPFTFNKRDEIPGTTLKSAGGVHTMELLGDTRSILNELFYSEVWYPTLVGISSRTHPPEWAKEILAKFMIYDTDDSSNMPSFTMMDVFTQEVCILDSEMDKYSQFEKLLHSANAVLPSNDRVQYKDAIFFDNEAGNCKQVAKLGVTCVYTPKGLTREAWENGISAFPHSRGILGPKLPY